MLIIISPAKTLDFDVEDFAGSTQPEFLNEASAIAQVLKQYSPKRLVKLLDISPRLADLNANRYAEWEMGSHKEKGKAAMLVYKGDVYQGLQADSFSTGQLQFAQKHLRIISGLYGALRPLDHILPYRLEMGTSLKVGKSKDLYTFWNIKVTTHIGDALKEMKSNILVNLASEEYFRPVDVSKIGAEVITPVFKDFKNGQYKIISIFAKKARGMMSHFIIQEGIQNPEDLKLFNEDGYYFNDQLTDGNKLVFTRR
jgi:uncharacterized protein